MRIGQIRHVNIITDTGSIRGVVIGAENINTISFSQRDVQNQGYRMDFGIVVLADLRIRVGTGRVEISQRYALKVIDVGKIIQYPFNH
jgi:hypothetical protein